MRLPLLLLPGLPCDARFFAPHVAALSDVAEPQVMVVAESSLAASAAKLLAAAPDRFLLAGNAYGGCLAAEVVAMAPERVAGLWLMNCNIASHPDAAGVRATVAQVRAGGYEAVLQDWAAKIVAPENAAARNLFLAMAREAGPEQFCRQYEALADRADRRATLAAYSGPTLLVWGEEDVFVPLEIGRQMAALMPRARFLTLSGCRHFPPLERPAETIAAAREWIAEVR